jgi:hypothetical protein
MNGTTEVLVLQFLDAAGDKRRIKIDDPKDDLNEETVLTAMNTIISLPIFAGPALVSPESAYFVITQTEEIFSQEV